jgi:1-aminocyclopropane-1-carboxylate deaminase/D-cysteine desulfhydrase-like pyridoxal-dependent ACC family enzyme
MADEWDGREMREKNQWSIDSWSALQSAATLLMMAVAGLIWGLKLEGRIDLIGTTHKADMDKIEGKVLMLETATQKGILPVTEVRMNGLKSEIDALRRDVDECAARKR